MTCTNAMLTVLMDGIKDANMWLDYASEAYSNDKDETGNWFKSHAKKRIDALENDYEYIVEEISLDEKINAGDEIATALNNHIENQMDELKRKYDAL